eukprot:Rhum_TRINITY_DN13663_c0_g1::Rhum_TRINITY_DN13663_c0_g1_i2::g.62500::m.62500
MSALFASPFSRRRRSSAAASPRACSAARPSRAPAASRPRACASSSATRSVSSVRLRTASASWRSSRTRSSSAACASSLRCCTYHAPFPSNSSLHCRNASSSSRRLSASAAPAARASFSRCSCDSAAASSSSVRTCCSEIRCWHAFTRASTASSRIRSLHGTIVVTWSDVDAAAAPPPAAASGGDGDSAQRLPKPLTPPPEVEAWRGGVAGPGEPSAALTEQAAVEGGGKSSSICCAMGCRGCGCCGNCRPAGRCCGCGCGCGCSCCRPATRRAREAGNSMSSTEPGCGVRSTVTEEGDTPSSSLGRLQRPAPARSAGRATGETWGVLTMLMVPSPYWPFPHSARRGVCVCVRVCVRGACALPPTHVAGTHRDLPMKYRYCSF